MDPTQQEYGSTNHHLHHVAHHISGALPLTGLDITLLVALAVALVFAGIMLHRHYRTS